MRRQAGAVVAVHCSAGIGRTGAVCLAAHAADCAEQARQPDGSCQVTPQMLADGLVLFRQQRSGMVQTDAQFEFAGQVSASFSWLLLQRTQTHACGAFILNAGRSNDRGRGSRFMTGARAAVPAARFLT
jgi:hypothetical protein